jgi:LPS export ABC transporter protein LptC/lipopolysaccharide transport protein LptA
MKKILSHLVRWASLVVLISVIALIVVTIVRRSRQAQPPPPTQADPILSDKVISITEGYHYTVTEHGRRTFQLNASRDTSYADGRHELEKIDLTSYTLEGQEHLRVQADRGVYRQAEGLVNLTGHVKVMNPDGLEVTTEALAYNQKEDVAATDIAVNFKRGDLSGSSVGAALNAKTRTLALQKDVHVIKAAPADRKDGLPVDIRSTRADYAEKEGVVRFNGEAVVTQGKQAGRADLIVGVFHPPAPQPAPAPTPTPKPEQVQAQKLDRIELRGNAILREEDAGQLSTLSSRDMDFFFDDAQHLKLALAKGSGRAWALEKGASREITAENFEAHYTPGEKSSLLALVVSQGRTSVKLGAENGAASSANAAERTLEADAVQVKFQPGGKFMAEAEATGNAVLVVTPVAQPKSEKGDQKAERKRIRAPKMKADFYETENAMKSFVADGGAIVEFEPLDAKSTLPRRTLTGKKITGTFHQKTQEIADLLIEGDAKFVEGARQATADRATYSANNETLALRSKPVIWDETARTNAEEIDVSLGDEVSHARGRVRTTYYSREKTGGAAPFKKNKAPVFITSERAIVRHREGTARYLGAVRAWQDDNFVSAETIELDRGERMMQAWEDVQSALYSIEREVEKNRKEVVPLFVSSERLTYREATRTINYDGRVKVRQGTDRIEAATAEALMDEENKLTRLTAAREVVLTQPERRGTGDQLEYSVAGETAILLGNLAQIEDRERGVTTKGARLTMHLRDARIEANDERGAKRVRTTHRIQR